MRNAIYKEIRAGGGTAWREKAEQHAENGASFVIRPFNKEAHWTFLSELCDRFDLVPTFNALERAAYFDARPVENAGGIIG
jgi:hypothetical protein